MAGKPVPSNDSRCNNRGSGGENVFYEIYSEAI
jgi:hypothetical protein